MRLLFLSLALSVAVSATVDAQIVRTWVSATDGDDGNPCTRSLPCRNFAAAINAVDPGGEVVVLDSGGYGPVVIDQSVSIICPRGIHGAIAPTAGNAVHVTAAGATVIVRGLYLNGHGGSAGIRHGGAGTTLQVESVVVSGFTDVGLLATQPLRVTDSTVRQSMIGILIVETSALVLDTLMLENPDGGLWIEDSEVTARNCGASGSNNGDGFLASAATAMALSRLTVERCFSTRNRNGFRVIGRADSSLTATGCSASQNEQAGFRAEWNLELPQFPSGPRAYVRRCTATQNQSGFQTDAGNLAVASIHSAENNFVFGNVVDVNAAVVSSPEE